MDYQTERSNEISGRAAVSADQPLWLHRTPVETATHRGNDHSNATAPCPVTEDPRAAPFRSMESIARLLARQAATADLRSYQVKQGQVAAASRPINSNPETGGHDV